ncbi:MAG: hypothetical protein R3B74_10785 [Nitrospirales bacterium]|nr:hypothetical protein [Nitrospirales bacterium]
MYSDISWKFVSKIQWKKWEDPKPANFSGDCRHTSGASEIMLANGSSPLRLEGIEAYTRTSLNTGLAYFWGHGPELTVNEYHASPLCNRTLVVTVGDLRFPIGFQKISFFSSHTGILELLNSRHIRFDTLEDSRAVEFYRGRTPFGWIVYKMHDLESWKFQEPMVQNAESSLEKIFLGFEITTDRGMYRTQTVEVSQKVTNDNIELRILTGKLKDRYSIEHNDSVGDFLDVKDHDLRVFNQFPLRRGETLLLVNLPDVDSLERVGDEILVTVQDKSLFRGILGTNDPPLLLKFTDNDTRKPVAIDFETLSKIRSLTEP